MCHFTFLPLQALHNGFSGVSENCPTTGHLKQLAAPVSWQTQKPGHKYVSSATTQWKGSVFSVQTPIRQKQRGYLLLPLWRGGLYTNI